jgi:hypothetical protein
MVEWDVGRWVELIESKVNDLSALLTVHRFFFGLLALAGH